MEHADTSDDLTVPSIDLASPAAAETDDKMNTELNVEKIEPTAEVNLSCQPFADHPPKSETNEDDEKLETSELVEKDISRTISLDKSNLDVATQEEDTSAPKPHKIPEESEDEAIDNEQFIMNIVEKIIADAQEVSDVKKDEKEAEEKVELISKHDTDKIAVVDGSASLADEIESIDTVTEPETPEKFCPDEIRDTDSMDLLPENGFPLDVDENRLSQAVPEVKTIDSIASELKEDPKTPVQDFKIDSEDKEPSDVVEKSELKAEPTEQSITLTAKSVDPVLAQKKLKEDMDGPEKSSVKSQEQVKDSFRPAKSHSPPKLPKTKKVLPSKDSHEATDKSAQRRVSLKRQTRLDRPQTHIPEAKPTSERPGVQKRGRSQPTEKLKSEKGKKPPPVADEKSILRPKDQIDRKTVDLPKKGGKKLILKRSQLGVEEKSSSSEGDKTEHSTRAAEAEKSSPEASSSPQKYTIIPIPLIPPLEEDDRKSTEEEKSKNTLELVETQSFNVLPLKPEDSRPDDTNKAESIEIKIDKDETEPSIQTKDSVESKKILDDRNLSLEPIPSTSGLYSPKLSSRDPSPSSKKLLKLVKEEPVEPQSRYMEWYKQNREETERRRQERRGSDDEEPPPKWLRKSTRRRWLKMTPEDRKHFDLATPELTPNSRRKIKPLVNVESEQLKAIIRQGRKLRKAEGDRSNDPFVEIFAPEKPPSPVAKPKYYLVQHSAYKYEKQPAPFYLHPPPAPHPSPRPSPQHFQVLPDPFPCPDEPQTEFEDATTRVSRGLRHQQLLEKKSVFDIAYSEASPSHLRSDSTTPPS